MLTKDQLKTAKETYLSPNFTLFELIKSDNYPELVTWPSEEVIEYLTSFCQDVLQPIRDRWGRIKLHSGYRNERLNKRVGGVSNSVHQIIYRTVALGVAADIESMDAPLLDMYNWIFESLKNVKTVILYRKPSVVTTPFVHVDTRLARVGRAKLEKTGPNTYVEFGS